MKIIRVWDPFVRFFHWALVIMVISQLATAEDFQRVHVRVGYFIIALLIARIIWGFVGSRYARFTDFVYSPTEIFDYLKGLLRRQPRHYTGHNPAGGAMVCALLFFLLLTTLSGLFAHKALNNRLAAIQPRIAVTSAWASDDGHGDSHENTQHNEINGKQEGNRMHPASTPQARFWKEIHETLVGITLFLIGLHFCGVLASSYLHRENLILSMITGKKKIS